MSIRITYLRKVVILLVIAGIIIGGTAVMVVNHLKSEDGKQYAVLSKISDNKMKLEINRNEWTPILGVHGFGGFKISSLYAAVINGEGPIFKNPEVLNSLNIFSYPEFGSITIDQKNAVVIIDRHWVLSKPGERLSTEPDPANGTYPLK